MTRPASHKSTQVSWPSSSLPALSLSSRRSVTLPLPHATGFYSISSFEARSQPSRPPSMTLEHHMHSSKRPAHPPVSTSCMSPQHQLKEYLTILSHRPDGYLVTMTGISCFAVTASIAVASIRSPQTAVKGGPGRPRYGLTGYIKEGARSYGDHSGGTITKE